MRRHADRVHAVVWRLVDDPHAAQDVTQETFLRAWKGIDRFNAHAQFSTWCYRIAVNEAHRHRERHTRGGWRAVRSLDHDPIDLPDLSQAPHRQAMQADLRRELERAVHELPFDYRAALILRDIEGLSTSQAAAVVGIGEPALKSRLHRARMTVRKAVRGYLVEADQ